MRVQAKTGSGKTAAFGLGLLQHIDPSRFETQSLVLCPTRELADQVAGELRRLARCLPNIKILMLCGGQPFGAQRDSLQHAPHIIVATPGRLLDHLQKGTVSLDALQTPVMDEADRMLDMGFSDAIDEVIRFAPADRQTLLFSATGLRRSRRSAVGCSVIRKRLRLTASMRYRLSNSSSLKFPVTARLRCSSVCLASISRRPAWCSAIPSAIAGGLRCAQRRRAERIIAAR